MPKKPPEVPQIRRTLVRIGAQDREKLRLELARAIRSNLTEEVAVLLAEAGDDGVQLLDELEDSRCVLPSTWGTDE